MIRISALSFRETFLTDLKLLSQTYPDIMLFYSGHDVDEFNKHYNLISDLVIVDHSIFDPQKVNLLGRLKTNKPDILILALIDVKPETDISGWLASGIDGIIPNYVGEKELHSSIIQMFTKRKFIHIDLATFVFSFFQTISPKTMEGAFLKPKSLTVLDLLSKGKSYAQIAEDMDTSIDSVRYYIKDIYGVLGIKNKGAAVGMYLRGEVA